MSIATKVVNLNEPSTAGTIQETNGTLVLERPSRVFLNLKPTDIKSYVRQGTDLIVDVDGDKLRIINFYHVNGDSKLYLNDEDCEGIVQVDLSPTVGDEAVIVQYIPQTEPSPFESLTCVAEDDVYGMVATAALIGLGVGLGVALSGDDDNGDPVPAAPDFGSVTEPPPSIIPPVVAPAISEVVDNAGPVQGPVAPGGSTDDSTPTVNGSGATPGDTITLYDGTTAIGSTTVAPDGTWSITPGAPLPEGSHNLTVTATDPAGNVSTPSDSYNVIIDTTAPAAPSIGSVTDDVGAVQGPIANGGSTDDTTPTANGSNATPGDTITLYDGDAVIGNATVAPDGTWSITPETPLHEGSHTLSVTATDPAGNKSATSAPYIIIVDTTAPSTGDGKNSISFNDGGDELLSGAEAANVTLSGQVEDGATVTGLSITDGSTTLTVAAADISVSGGVVSVAGQDLSAFNDGTLTVTMSVTDAAGNSGSVTDTTVLDSTAPTAPSIGSVTDDVGAVQGPVANGGSTDDSTPTVNGSGATPGDTITLYDGTTAIGSTTVDASGNWSITPATPLPEGSHSFTATATDPVGNESGASAAFTLTIDTTTPAGYAPTLSIAEAADGINAAELSDGIQAVVGLTPGTQVGDTITITTTGTGGSVSTHTITAADVAAGSAAVTLTGSSAYADGSYSATAVISDAAGNSSAPSNTVNFSVDATSPGGDSGTDAPTLSIAEAADGINADELSDGIQAVVGLTPGTQVGDTITIMTTGTGGSVTMQIVTAADVAAGSAAVTLTGSSAYADGSYSAMAVISDAAGNSSAPSAAVAFTVDTTAPVNGDGKNSISFNDGGDELLSGAEAANVTLSGQVEDGATVTGLSITDGSTTLTVAAADISVSGGVVSVAGQDLSGFNDGTLTVTMSVTDAAGNSGAITDTTVLDSTASGVTLDPLTTNDTTPELTGTVTDPAATVVVTVGGTDYPATNHGDGTWTLPDNTLPVLPEGDTTVTVTATDPAGNTSTATGTVVVDTTAPSTGDGKNSISFNDGGDELLSGAEAANVTLSGQVEAGATVTGLSITDGSTTLTVAAADISVSGGVVSVAGQDLSGFNDGTLTVTMSVTDAAGNSGAITDTTVLDSTASGVTLDPLTTNDTTPELTGTVTDPAATVVVTVGGTDYPATNHGDGTWTLPDNTLPVLPEGDTTVTVTATDPAGNTSTATGTVVVDTTAPSTGDGKNSISFNDGGDELLSGTEAANVTLSGQVEAGATVTGLSITDGSTTLTVAAADISVSGGVVSVAGQDLSGFNDGTLTVTMSVTDAAGNSGAITDTTVLDSTASGVTLDPLTTNDTTPELTGTVTDPAATVVVTVGGTDYPATNHGDGTWTLPDNTLPALPEGNTAVTVTATDPAGNTSTATGTVVVDTTAPSTGDGKNSISFNDGGDELLSGTEAANVTLSGQVEAGATVTGLSITDGSTTLTVAAADISVSGGVVSVAGQDLSGFNDGTLTVTMSVTDAAGNSGAITDTTVLDSTASGVTLDPLTTNDTTPELTGTVTDPAATVVVTVGGTDYPATNHGDGTWTLPDNTLPVLPEGDTTVTVTATDPAGNTSTATGTVVVDTTAPSTGDGKNSISFNDGGDELLSGTEAANVTLSGQVEAGATVTGLSITDGSTTLTVAAADISVSGGVVSVAGQDLSGFNDGTLTVTMSVTDAAGNSGAITDTTVLDSTASGVTLDPLTTNDTTPELTGTVTDPAATVVVTVGGTDYPATNHGDGTWTLPDNTLPVLPEGDTTVTVTATDPAGNTSTATGTVVVDTTAPSTGDGKNSISFNDGGDELLSGAEAANVTLSGQVEDGATVTGLSITDGSTTLTVAAADISVSGGVVSVAGQDLSGFNDGTLTVTMSVTDAAGNSGAITDTTVLDSTASGVTLDPLTTNDTTPELTGTVTDPAATVVVTVGGTDYPATNHGDGTWTLPDNTLPVLPEGDTTVTVTATDPAGNTSTATGTVVVDTTAPSTGDGKNSISFNDGGDELLSGTEAANVTLSGQVEAGATVTGLSITDGSTTLTVAAADISVSGGVVSVAGQDLSGFNDGTLTVTMSVTDAAGNSGAITDTTVLDSTASGVTLDPLTTNDTTPELTGTVTDPAATVVVTVGGTDYPATNHGDGTWTLPDNTLPVLPEGDTTVTVTATDPAGNTSTATGTVVVDTTAPSTGDGKTASASTTAATSC
ncbi:Ig-like domain-containing protein [Methylobacter sp. YRD-M1]|uniref:Ig-like domain-containing protein n=1 Tax=Methylobacter sp. YRD-M1 TaxID=2911520 RepID=UPI003FA38A1B